MSYMLVIVHFSSRHRSEEQRTMIKKMTGEESMYKYMQKMIGCTVQMISNALKRQPKRERRGRKQKTTVRMD